MFASELPQGYNAVIGECGVQGESHGLKLLVSSLGRQEAQG